MASKGRKKVSPTERVSPSGRPWPASQVEQRAVTQLTPYAKNARTHSDDQVAQIAASIQEWGWTVPILVDEDGTIIAGHGRILAAKKLGIESVPVMVAAGWTEAQKRAYVIADNKLAENAGWDESILSTEMLDLADADFDLGLTGFSADELADLFHTKSEGLTDPDDVPDPPENPVSQVGDVWLLGAHRLLCGDSTNAEDVALLMAGEKATLLATDPPYLVDYTGSNHPAEHHKKAGRKASPGKELGNKHWDAYIDPDVSVAFFADYLALALVHCVERVPIYQWHATRRQVLVEQAWAQNDLLVHQTIIWVKPRGVLTRSHFLWAHEPCFYGWRKGMQPEKDRRPDSSERTVWEISQQGQQDGIHPTQKPLEVFEKPIDWHTRRGEVCLEPFSGSGTQIIAAERLGRRCFAMEKSPSYVDVAVVRWQEFTGQEATLEADGRTFQEVSDKRLKDAA